MNFLVAIAVGFITYIGIAVPVGFLVGFVLPTANAGHLLGFASYVVIFSSFVLACLAGRWQYRRTNRRERKEVNRQSQTFQILHTSNCPSPGNGAALGEARFDLR